MDASHGGKLSGADVKHGDIAGQFLVLARMRARTTYLRAPGAAVISSRILSVTAPTAMRNLISSSAHNRWICTESATWFDPILRRA